MPARKRGKTEWDGWSMRTLIEIDHDYLHRLHDEGAWRYLLDRLTSPRTADALENGQMPEVIPGVRIIAQRHQTDDNATACYAEL